MTPESATTPIPPASLSRSTDDSRGRALVLLAAFLGWMFDGMEMGIFPLVARPALQQMQLVSGVLDEQFVQRWTGIVTAWFLLGAACGGLVFGWLGDRMGRVKAISSSILCYSLFTGMCYFATSPWQLGAFRFLAALGMGGEWALGVALVMEIWPENKRPLMAGLIGAAANVGYALIAVIAIQFPITQKSWRWVMLVGAAPALLIFFISFFVPESKKWQASVKKGSSRPVREIFSPALRKRTLLAIAFASIPLIVTWGIVQWIPVWADHMTAGTQPKVKAYIQLVSSIGAITGCLIAALVGGAFGRRPTYAALCCFALLVCSILFRSFHQYNSAFLFMVGIVGFGSAAFYGWMPLYLPELFPTRVRATGQGLAYNFGRILAALGAWQMGALMALFDKNPHGLVARSLRYVYGEGVDSNYARAGATIVLIYVVGMLVIWLAPETKGKPLPE